MRVNIKYQIIRRTDVVNPDDGSPLTGDFVIADDLVAGQVRATCSEVLPKHEQRNSTEAFIQEYDSKYDESKPIGERYSHIIMRECRASDWIRRKGAFELKPIDPDQDIDA